MGKFTLPKKSPTLSSGLIKTYRLGNRDVYVYPNQGWDIFTGDEAECIGLIEIVRPEPCGTIYSYWENSYKWAGDNGHWRTKRFNGHIGKDGKYGKGGEETGSQKEAFEYFADELRRIRQENQDVKINVSVQTGEYAWMTIDKFYKIVLKKEWGSHVRQGE